jgi:hypothetical protein
MFNEPFLIEKGIHAIEQIMNFDFGKLIQDKPIRVIAESFDGHSNLCSKFVCEKFSPMLCDFRRMVLVKNMKLIYILIKIS